VKLSTDDLHRRFIDALGDGVVWHGDLGAKPLEIDLRPPLPRRLRLYQYSLVVGGQSRLGEFKAVLRVPGQEVGHYGSFEYLDERLTMLVAYSRQLDVFVLWDASLHERFKAGGNVQVKDTVVEVAAATGYAEQRRRLTSGATEVVVACRSDTLARAVRQRVLWTGGV
jgi:hypothetical protein